MWERARSKCQIVSWQYQCFTFYSYKWSKNFVFTCTRKLTTVVNLCAPWSQKSIDNLLYKFLKASLSTFSLNSLITPNNIIHPGNLSVCKFRWQHKWPFLTDWRIVWFQYRSGDMQHHPLMNHHHHRDPATVHVVGGGMGTQSHRSSRGSDTSSAYSGSDTMHSSVPSSDQVRREIDSFLFNAIFCCDKRKGRTNCNWMSDRMRRALASTVLITTETRLTLPAWWNRSSTATRKKI